MQRLMIYTLDTSNPRTRFYTPPGVGLLPQVTSPDSTAIMINHHIGIAIARSGLQLVDDSSQRSGTSKRL